MNVQSNDFKRQWEAIQADVLNAVKRVGASGWYILGQHVQAFERALADHWPIPCAVGVGNGLDAIEIGLRCLGVRADDRVLTTPLSAFATTLAVLRIGAIPVFVDVDANGLIDLEQCREALKSAPTIRCLLPVHLYGQAVDLDALQDLKSEFELPILEDCAQSIHAQWRSRSTGTVGQVAATSFYPTKNLGALGDAGALLTTSEEIAQKAKALRNYGQSAQYVHDSLGLNSRLDELHAAILTGALLPRLAEWTQRRRTIAVQFQKEINHPSIQLPSPPVASNPCWHLFPVLVAPEHRASLFQHLRANGVAAAIHYPTLIPDQRALTDYGRYEIRNKLSRAQRFVTGEVSLPIHPFLRDDEVAHVISTCNAWRGA